TAGFESDRGPRPRGKVAGGPRRPDTDRAGAAGAADPPAVRRATGQPNAGEGGGMGAPLPARERRTAHGPRGRRRLRPGAPGRGAAAAAGRMAGAVVSPFPRTFYTAAGKEYHEAIRLYPKYAPAHNNLGIVLEAQGERAAAVKEYREAIRLDPKFAEAHCNL